MGERKTLDNIVAKKGARYEFAENKTIMHAYVRIHENRSRVRMLNAMVIR